MLEQYFFHQRCTGQKCFKNECFFTLQFVFGYLIRKCLRASPSKYVPLLANMLTKMFSIDPNIFFRKEVNVNKLAGLKARMSAGYLILKFADDKREASPAVEK